MYETKWRSFCVQKSWTPNNRGGGVIKLSKENEEIIEEDEEGNEF